MDWSTILGTTAAAASGGVFGFVGSIFGAGIKMFQAKQEHKQKIELMRIQMEVDDKKGSWDGLKASHEADASIGGTNAHKWVNDVKALYRPALTTLLIVYSMHMFNSFMSAIVGDGSKMLQVFTQGEMKEIIKYIVYSIIFTASSAAMWWYGDRTFQPKFMKNL